MDTSENCSKPRKYSVKTADGVSRIYTITHAPNDAGLCDPCCISPSSSGQYQKRSRQGLDSNILASHNPTDAYVYLDADKNKVIILDDGRPYPIPVNISGKYTITNTASQLTISIKKDKFGTMKNVSSALCDGLSQDTLRITKRNMSTDKIQRTSFSNKDCILAEAQRSELVRKELNPCCQSKGKRCYCKKCGK